MKKHALFFIIVLLTGYIPASRAAIHDLKSFSGEPRFVDIVQQAFHSERLEWKDYDKMLRKMKKAPWLPTFYAGADHAFKETQAVSISDNISVSSTGVVVGPEDNDWDQSSNQGTTLRFRAVWQLGETLFPSQSLNMAREKRDIIKARQEIRDRLFKIYAKRKDLIGRYRSSPNKKTAMEIELLTELIDDWTGGVFHGQWGRVS